MLPENESKEKKLRTFDDMKVINLMQGPPAKNAMTACESHGWHPCINTFENDSIENAIRIIQRSGLHHLLVFNKNNNLVGTLSSHDIIKGIGRGQELNKKK